MEKYGGLHKELIVQETDQDGIRYSVVDYTRMIWRSPRNSPVRLIPTARISRAKT